jgi:energy-converting hydrogenase B subunit D
METILMIVAVFAVVTALVAATAKDRVVAVLAAGATGLFASIIFIILGAPDVAMTEAAIGSGLTTFIFFFALKKVRSDKNG